MDGPKRRRARLATGCSVESLEAHKLNRAIWSGSRSRVWFTTRVHQAWKIYKGLSLFNTDNDFAAHLLSLEMARLQRSVVVLYISIISPLLLFACGIEVQLL